MTHFSKKPTAAQITAAIKGGLARSRRAINLSWGENWIEVLWTPYGLIGSGWIGQHSGQDIAEDISRKFPQLLEA